MVGGGGGEEKQITPFNLACTMQSHVVYGKEKIFWQLIESKNKRNEKLKVKSKSIYQSCPTIICIRFANETCNSPDTSF